MFEPYVKQVLDRLGPEDVVLDVGGRACPFNRAQWVIDAEAYETRGYYAEVGLPAWQAGEHEWFSKDTWVRRDICSREPFPFPTKFFDFVVCSHTLEDIRDPLGVCEEIMRVGRAGYIEVPSKAWELTRGSERPGTAGLSHHRWIIEIDGDEVRFFPKYGLVHGEGRFSLPANRLGRMRPEQTIQSLWWQDSFRCIEMTVHGIESIEELVGNWVVSILDDTKSQTATMRPRRSGVSRLRQRFLVIPSVVKRRLHQLWPSLRH